MFQLIYIAILAIILIGDFSSVHCQVVGGTVSDVACFTWLAYGFSTDPATGDIYFGDYDNWCVAKYTTSNVRTSYSGKCGAAYGSTDGPAGSATLRAPYDARFDPLTKNVYVSEWVLNSVRKIDINGYVSTLGVFTTPKSTIIYPPTGMLLVSDDTVHCIKQISPTGGTITTFAGMCGTSGSTNGQLTSARFNLPLQLSFDSNQSILYVADSGNKIVRSIVGNQVSNAYTGTFAVSGVSVDKNSGILYLASGSCVRAIDPTGTAYVYAGSCTTAGKANGAATSAKFNGAYFIDYNYFDGSVVVTEGAGNKCIRRITSGCPVNSYKNAANVCVPICQPGYQFIASSNTCSLCPTDTYKNVTGSSSCLSCSIGTESVTNRTMCVTCPTGKYRPNTSPLTACISCPVNSVCTPTSFTCNPGFGYDSPSNTCVQCTTGKYKSISANTACLSCPVGSEVNPARTVCSSCAVGKYRSDLTADSCLTCPANSNCTLTGFQCNTGTAYNTTLSSCVSCPVGYEISNDGTQCIPCGDGYYRPSLLYYKCIPCPRDAICSLTGFTCSSLAKVNSRGDGCDVCPVGQESNSARSACVACVSGVKYRSSLTQSSCLTCPINAACSITGFTCNAGYEPTSDGLGCQLCDEGYTKSASGNTICTQCSIGTESATNRQSCAACGTGKYRPLTTFNKCVPCPANGACTVTVLTCNAGYKLNAAGDGCDVCPIGQESNAGRTTCVSCTAGSNYRSSLTQSSCLTCPINAACTTTGFTCNAGYEPTGDGLGCQLCDEGYTKSAAGNTACAQCAAGTESSANKQSCINCSFGKYRPSTTSNKCVPCPQNANCTYSSLSCNLGYKLNAATDGCDQCPVGQESNAGRTACVSCTSGVNFRSSLTQPTCQICPSNSACINSGFTCNSGYEISADGTSCQICQEGYSKSSFGNAACSQCSIGTESATNKQSCTACGTGKYRSSLAFNKCIPCPPYGVCTASAFTKCLNGYKKNSAGDGCEQCPIGQDSSDGLTCVGCQAGYFKPTQDFEACIICPYGSSCGGSSITCQTGYYFDTNSQCKRNDTFFAMQQVSSATASTVTAYLTLTQTTTSTTTSFSTNTVTSTSTQLMTATTTTTETSTTTDVSTTTQTSISIATSTTTETSTTTSVSTQTVFASVTVLGVSGPVGTQSIVFTSTVINQQTIFASDASTVTITNDATQNSGTVDVGSSQQSQNLNSVTLDLIGTLPISPFIFGLACLGVGILFSVLCSLICCRKNRVKADDFEVQAMTTTSAMNNTTSQRTFTNNSAMR